MNESHNALTKKLRPAHTMGIKHLYKYRSIDKNTLKILGNHELYFAKLSEFNDPWEGKPNLVVNGNQRSINCYCKSLVKKYLADSPEFSRISPQERIALGQQLLNRLRRNPQQHFQDSLWRIISNYGILSLSENPDHPLMWSHYADSHKGICIEFDTSSHYFSYAYQVYYEQHFPTVCVDTESPRNDDKIAHIAILTKASFWSYEQEWRIVFPLQTEEEKSSQIKTVDSSIAKELIGLHNGGSIAYKFPPQAITAIIFGAQISTENKKSITKIVKEHLPHSQLKEAKLHSTEFKLEINHT